MCVCVSTELEVKEYRRSVDKLYRGVQESVCRGQRVCVCVCVCVFVEAKVFTKSVDKVR